MSAAPLRHGRLLAILAAIFAVQFVWLGVAPLDRNTWLLENALVVVMLPLLFGTRRAFALSRLSYLLIFAFLVLHEVGAHYTYSLVPYDEWFRALFGRSLNDLMGWQRNHFDRAIHFFYGLLLAYPIREMFVRIVHVRGFWGYFLPLDLTMSTSMIYELIEWGAAVAFGGELGMHYLGTQGDIWDAHKDMALASLGAVIAMAITGGVNLSLQRDFAVEWAESFRVKDPTPLGEERIGELLSGGPSRGA